MVAPLAAQAHVDVGIGINLGAPLIYEGGYYAPPPVYYAPPPVYYVPAAPVYYYGAPRVYYGGSYYGYRPGYRYDGYRDHDRYYGGHHGHH
ncbi:MAG: hypothetical protein NVS9B10_16460 [Nevskia sp.]